MTSIQNVNAFTPRKQKPTQENISKVQFRGTSNNTVEVQDNTEKKGLSSGAKWAIGLGLTALATYGIYALTKGKVKGTKPTPTPTPTPTSANPVSEIKEMAMDAFKKGGKFEKGKAILADGTKYTGNITSTGKDGSKLVMEYVDGVLQKSTKTAKDGTEIFNKAYTWAEDGLIKEVKKNGKIILNEDDLIKTYIMANHKLINENPNSLKNSHPEVIKNLEEIYEDVFNVNNRSFIEAVNDRNGLIKSTLNMYGLDFNVYGGIVDNVKLEKGLVNLRKQNKELNQIFNKSIDTSLDKRFTGVLDLYQRLDNYLTDKSLKKDSAAKDLRNKIRTSLHDSGYLFTNYTPSNTNAYTVLGRGAIPKEEIVGRAIVDFNGNVALPGKVWLPE